MDLDNLKSAWQTLDEKLDKNWQLNLEIIRSTNLDKAKQKLNQLVWLKVTTAVFYLLVFSYLMHFMVINIHLWYYAVSASLVAIWMLAIAITAFHEFAMIIRLDFGAPITVLQKELSKIKFTSIRYLRLILWIFPMNLALIILFFKFIFGVDIFMIASLNWLLINLFVSIVVFIPFMMWGHQKLSPKNAETKWMNKLLQGNGSQITEALQLIEKIKKFEQDKL